MTVKSGIYVRILASFGIFVLVLALVMGVTAYFTTGDLSRDFLSRRLGLVLQTLIEAEKHERSGEDSRMDARELVRALDLNFFVGKQVKPQWASLPDGLHLIENGKEFTLLKRLDGVIYALCGSAEENRAIMGRIRSMLLACAALGLVATILLAIFLSKRLSRPLQALSASIGNAALNASSSIPAEILERKDETGKFARALQDYQNKTKIMLEREKSFTSAASHELRNPLAVIAGALEILEAQTEGMEKTRPTLERLVRTTENMSVTVSSLLCLARGEKQDMARIDLALILGRVLHDFAPDDPDLQRPDKNLPKRILTITGIEIVVGVIPGLAIGNPDLAAISLRNLLENAFRHGDGKIIYIEGARNCILIRNKPGARGADSSGSGFGLLIAQRACEKMNWRLSRANTDNETIFRIDLLVDDV